MVLKHPDECLSGDAFAQAIQFASWDVAGSLRSLLALGGGFRILHDLRLERFGMEAWIDHLLVHRFGLILIESRTLCVRSHRDDAGLWYQQHEGAWQEVNSPVKRVRQNARFVVELLRAHQGEFLTEGMKRDIVARLEVDVYVSIASQADFTTDGHGFSTIVVNARELGGLINARHQTRYFSEQWWHHKRFIPRVATLSEEEIHQVGRFLLKQHKHLPRSAKYDPRFRQRYFAVTSRPPAR